MKKPTFKHIPGELSTEELLGYNDDIGVHTYGMWIIRATENPNLVLATTRYNSRIPMLPTWKLHVSEAPWTVDDLRQSYSDMWSNHTKVHPKDLDILPFYANTPVEDGHFTENRSFPIMPVVGHASVYDEKAMSTEWLDRHTFNRILEENIAGDNLYSPYVQLCLQGLQLARQYRASLKFIEANT
jgi:hypothetical protein